MLARNTHLIALILSATLTGCDWGTPDIEDDGVIDFETIDEDQRISTEYLDRGVRFINDSDWGAYNSVPTIHTIESAHSGSNVLRLDSTAEHGLQDAPMVILFTRPLTQASAYLGCIDECESGMQATVSTYDCNGNLVDSDVVTPTTEFDALAETSSQGDSGARTMVISNDSPYTMETIDLLSFSYMAEDDGCVDTTPPSWEVTSAYLASNGTSDRVWVLGTASDNSGVVAHVVVGGQLVRPWPSIASDGSIVWNFSADFLYSEGQTTFEIGAVDYNWNAASGDEPMPSR